MKKEEVRRSRERASEMCEKAGIVLTAAERENMEVVDFGLGDIDRVGLEVVVYENNDRYCAKELIMFPRQLCAEHRHPYVDASNPGKRETFRCRWGEMYLYVEGEPTAKPKAVLPAGEERHFTVWHEIILCPGDQFTLPPNSLHWFQAGDKGAIVSEFSSSSTDENDIWTNPDIQRIPIIE